MTIIIFLVDTSASMNQRTYLGTSLLDVAKSAVETFMKIRARDPSSRWDRYMLLTFEDPPSNIKAGWKESHATFINELRNLTAYGLTSMGPALKATFDLLNVNRMQTGIDTYGQGRCPFFLEPAIIICISDGRKITTGSSVQSELNLPMGNIVPGSELTKEPFRWDQRLFGLMLRLPATPVSMDNSAAFIPSCEDSPIDVMCEVTGGRSYCVTSQRTLIGSLESLVSKCQNGVVINFEKIGADPPPVEHPEDGPSIPLNSVSWQNCRKMIIVPRSAQKGFPVGHWPIPEAFWPDIQSQTLPPRDAHPIVKFSCTSYEPMVLENFPFDKYEMEPSPLTQYILERRQPNVAWQVFVANSAKYSDIGHPFGYLKASSNLQTVNLFVMPYNYPALLPLIDELQKVLKMKATQAWRQKFDNYLKTMPIYYAQKLKHALARLNMGHLILEQMESCLNYSIVSYLKKLKNQAKMEHERLVASVGLSTPPPCDSIRVLPPAGSRAKSASPLLRKDFHQLLEYYGSNMSYLKQELLGGGAGDAFENFTLAVPKRSENGSSSHTYKNPFDISRKFLLDQVGRMRANLLQRGGGQDLGQEAGLHSQPVQMMGNYQEYLKRMPQPLRELETTPVRQHTFGNPFKVNKNLMIDEADEAMPGQATAAKKRSAAAASLDSPPMSPRPNKRKPGPLPRDIPTSRLLLSPSPSPSPSPCPSPQPESTPVASPLMMVMAEGKEAEVQQAVATDIVRIDLSESTEEETDDIPGSGGDHRRSNGTTSTAFYKQHNYRLKKLVIREVKRPGKNYEQLFQQMNKVQGPAKTKCLFVRAIIHEALRFKKRILAKNYEQLFHQMNKVQGPAETKCLFVRAIIHEALRFKKRILANLLQQFEQSILQMESNNKVTNHVR